MMAYMHISSAWQVFFQVSAFILGLTAIYCVIMAAVLHLKTRWIIFSIGLFLFSYLMLQPMIDITYHLSANSRPTAFSLAFGRLPMIIPLGILIATWAVTLMAMIKIRICRNTRLSPRSIAEGVNFLPTGLCFFADDGTVLLGNEQMEELCYHITGKTLLDANALCNALGINSPHNLKRTADEAPNPAMITKDGRVWSFECRVLETKLGRVMQLSATEITEINQKRVELEEQVLHLQELNMRIRQYNEMIADVTREEERLAAKISIHDKMGRALITTRRYIESEDMQPQEQLLALWKSSIAFLRGEGQSGMVDNPLWEIKNAAELAGVSVIMTGEPKNCTKKTLQVMKAAALECLNNSVHHGGGTELTIAIKQSADYDSFTISNNGRVPTGKIIEGGGLTGLRRRVRLAHGEMQILSSPVFALKVTVPRKEVESIDERTNC